MPRPRLVGPVARPRLTTLEPRDVPASGLVAAADGARVVLTDLETGAARGSVTPFPDFTGPLSVALADVTGDGVADLIAGAGPGGGPRVRVFDGTDFAPLFDAFVFDPSFTGGVTVAAGDVDGNGIADLVVGAGPGGGPHVRAINVRTGAEVVGLFAFDPSFAGGVNVGAVDQNADGIDDLLFGAGPGGGPHVRVVDPTTTQELASFFAYDSGFAGGVSLAGADPDQTGRGVIVTGAGPGGGPVLRTFHAGQVTAEFLAADPTSRGGVAVAAFAAGNGWRIAAGVDGTVRVFDGDTGVVVGSTAGGSAVGLARVLLGPVLHAETPGEESFVDPTALVSRIDRIEIGRRSFVAPFAVLDATAGPIRIGNGSNIQDNVELVAAGTGVVIGDHAILAHNATVLGASTIGAAGGEPCFIGFNAVVDNATVEPGAFVSSLTRLGPGVVLPAGMKTLVGKFIRTQAEADDPALGKVDFVTDADRKFMADVLHVNEAFASGYARLFAEGGIRAVSGVGANPGGSDFNPNESRPTFAGGGGCGCPYCHRFRNRLIGDSRFEDTLRGLDDVMGRRGAIRADEGTPFEIGTIRRMGDRTTFHALEHTGIRAGSQNSYGSRVLIHGGSDDGNSPHELTRIGDDVTVADWAVVFRSTIGDGVSIGFRAYVDGSQLPPGTVIPDRAVVIDNVVVGVVEW